ncbi:hypothetical protein AB0C84_04760 [Actinomadura sp. NPDC048955]|uniref:hypothetical protein n=1 Tax=Actinomadura sp. NPDC048955 TaxID=3158228 RepID=UPI0033EBD9A1
MAAPGRPPRLVFLVALTCAVASCGSPRTTPDTKAAPSAAISSPAPASASPSPPGGLPDLTRLDQHDATAVSKAALTLMWIVDSTTDHSQRDAYQRAAPLLDEAYKASVAAQPGGLVPGQWTEHRAYAKVRLTPQRPQGDVPTDTPTLAHRGWAITVIPTGRDKWKGAPVHATAFVTLKRKDPGAPWRVSAVGTA